MEVTSWWALLCTIAVINIIAWAVSATVWARGPHSGSDADTHRERRLQVILAAGYVFGCAFRSVVPVFDVPRLGLFDSWISSSLVGRSVATVAELCFAAQWALITREIGRVSGSTFAIGVARWLVPFIALAEVCSWFSVLTTSNAGHVIENSIWGASAALVVTALALVLWRGNVAPRAPLVIWCLGGLAYVLYMFLADVPMYWARWAMDDAMGRGGLTLWQGVQDALQRRVVSYSWEDWRSEVVWMTLYFSVAVWISISLIHAPAFRTDAWEPMHSRRAGAL